MEHPNAEILRGMAEGKTAMARSRSFAKFIPLDQCSTTAHIALLRGPTPGLELQGVWEFKLSDESGFDDEDNECKSCDGTGEGIYEGQSCIKCGGRCY